MSGEESWRERIERAFRAPAPSNPNNPLASEWKERAETLELKLKQLLEAQCQLIEQLMTKITSPISLQVKKTLIADLQKEFSAEWDELSIAVKDLEEKIKEQLEEMIVQYKNAEAKKIGLEYFLTFLGMKNEEQLNEANAQLQVDDIVYQRVEDAGCSTEPTVVPSACKHKIDAHEGGCRSVLFEHNISRLVTGGWDGKINIWDTNTGKLTQTLNHPLRTVFDLTITHDNRFVIAAGRFSTMYVWDVSSGLMCHLLSGHLGEVYAVDASPVASQHVASAGSDRTMKIWDLESGICTNTISFNSSCTALCFSKDGDTICSGHTRGNLRLWDVSTGKEVHEVVNAHSRSLTSVSISGNGNLLLTSGMDNVHNLFDMRSMELCGTLRAAGCMLASNWSRSCLSPDEKYVAAGSGDGSVYLWSTSKGSSDDLLCRDEASNILKEHEAPVWCCSWSGLGKPLASADKDGMVCIWE